MSLRTPARLGQLMADVVAYARDHVHGGGIPFTAFVVDANGIVLGRGVNRVLEHHDPTAHAEVEAIREACRNVAASHLRGATLLASGEPCAMCYLSALYAGIGEVVFAVDRDEAAAYGFDYRRSYEMLADFPHRWPMHIQKHSTEGAFEPFELIQQKRNLP